jgi:hypothetical protein
MKKPKFTDRYCTTQIWWKSVLDLGDCTRRYSVNYGGWNGGQFKNFWFFRNALKFAETRSDVFVDIYDEMHQTSLRIRGE